MIDKDTALGLIALLRIATDESNVPYVTGELKASALDAIDDVLSEAESEVEAHFNDEYRHDWYDTCKYCEAGVLPDKRQNQDEQEQREELARANALYLAEQRRLSRRALAANDEDPENPFRG